MSYINPHKYAPPAENRGPTAEDYRRALELALAGLGYQMVPLERGRWKWQDEARYTTRNTTTDSLEPRK